MFSVTTARGRTDSTTNVTHTTSAGGDARIDVDEGNTFPNMGAFSLGTHGAMIMHDGGREMIFLNPDKKQYVSVKPFAMMEGVQKMLEGMGGSMSVDTSGVRVNLDSIGPGPAIDGHPTVTYRLKIGTRMTISMMGRSQVIDNQSTQEIQSATDIGEFAGGGSLNRFAEVFQSMGLPKAYFDNFVATRRKMRGFPLRTVSHTTSSVNGITRTAVQTIESRHIKRLLVPDSLFVIPSDYKPVAMPAMPGMPGMPGTGDR